MRRTKQAAAITRRRIVAAALREFHRRGYARTTLAQIAKSASVTRGAIYWHFAGKLALFRAIRESVSLPLLDRSDLELLREQEGDPLARVAAFLKDLYRGFEEERATRLTYELMSFKCEYVAELAGERQALIVNSERLRNALESAYAQARARGTLRPDVTPRIAALETIAFVSGLMRLSTLDNGRIGMRRDAALVIDAHVDARRVRVPVRATAIARERQRAGADPDGTAAAPRRQPYLRIVSGK
jgi:TetR/AcrR family transcriptional regulator, acrAB operon repressor